MGVNTGDSSASANTSACRRCKAKTVNGLKCNICGTIYHNSCAKFQSNVIFIDDNNIQCCNNEVIEGKSVNESSIESDFYDAINEMANEQNKTDVRIIRYIIQQKNDVIHELRNQIKVLSDQLEATKSSSPNISVPNKVFK